MDESQSRNRVLLCGTPLSAPEFSHANRGNAFYTFPLEVVRLSGTADRLNILLREELLPALRPSRAGLITVEGELRSFNNRSGVGRRLIITVFARELATPATAMWENEVSLTGTLCRPSQHRVTPLGREITDLMLAVNRNYGRSDYLPCVVWGQSARLAASYQVGDRVTLRGRLQSRDYIKNLDGVCEKRTAYEVSVAELARVSDAEESTGAVPFF